MAGINLKNKHIILITILLLGLIALITVPRDLLDVTDLNDYSDTAKYFAGEYRADHRSSHSMIYGFVLSPFVIFDSFVLLKIISIIWLILIIISIYYISNKNRKTLLLFLTAPLLWYMAPWLSPVQAAALFFLWAYHFVRKFENTGKNNYILYAGLLTGLATSFWDTALYYSAIFLVSFFYNKKFYLIWLFLSSMFLGLLPRLIFDQAVFGFAFFGILKNFLAVISFGTDGGIYQQGYNSQTFFRFLIFFIFIPICFFKFYKKKNFLDHKKTMIFLTLSLLFSLTDPVIKLIFFLLPIMILLLGENLNEKQFRIQITIFIFLTILVIVPYLIQFRYEVNARDIVEVVIKNENIKLIYPFTLDLIKSDLEKIEKDYPNEVFLVGPDKDYYRRFAHLYWGDRIKKFVSIEDYQLYFENKTIISSKEIRTNASGDLRREMWLEVGIGRNHNDNTDYNSIKYGLSLDEDDIGIIGFKLIKKYERLYLFEKQLS